MAYKNILVYVDDHKSNPTCVQAAVNLARDHDAHLAGLYVSVEPVLPAALRAEVAPDLLRTLQEQAKERADAAVARFNKAVDSGGISGDCRTTRSPATSLPDVISLHARYADLTVIGQDGPDGAANGEGHLAEEVVLSSGKPILVIPYIGAGKTMGTRVMVAWDASREAARAVADAMPMLEKAREVLVLAVNPRESPHGAEPGADIALHLARHGIKAEAQRIEAHDISVADALLSRVADLGVDLLVMGAYGHSRLREVILGGVTRQVFEQMTVPVLMTH